MSSKHAVLRLNGITKSFEIDSGPLDNLSLDVFKGEILGLIGKSGTGKTTLLNIAAGYLTPDSGSVDCSGESRLFYFFQQNSLLPWKTIRKNIQLAKDLSTESNSREGFNSIIKRTGLEHHLDLYPSELSGGLSRRAVLAVALASQANLILADEPFSSLDEPTRLEFSCWLRKLAKECGWTVVIVSHSIDELTLMCDRVVLLEEHRIQDQIRIPDSTYRNARALMENDSLTKVGNTLRNWLFQENENEKI